MKYLVIEMFGKRAVLKFEQMPGINDVLQVTRDNLVHSNTPGSFIGRSFLVEYARRAASNITFGIGKKRSARRFKLPEWVVRDSQNTVM